MHFECDTYRNTGARSTREVETFCQNDSEKHLRAFFVSLEFVKVLEALRYYFFRPKRSWTSLERNGVQRWHVGGALSEAPRQTQSADSLQLPTCLPCHSELPEGL